jgi:ATP-dependent helicase/nuclease subunit A
MPDNRRRPPVIMVKPDPDGPDVPFWVLAKTPRSATVQGWCGSKLDSAGDEYRRLLYVAMTRARDELYVCGWHNHIKSKPDCWYELMKGALATLASEVPDPDGGTVWRMGSVDVWAEPQSAEQAADAPPPDWLKTPLASPTIPIQPVPGFSERPRSPVSSPREVRMARGRFVHRLLQRLPELAEEARPAMAALLAQREGFAAEVADSALNLIADPRYAAFFASAGLAEVPVVMRGADGRPIAGQIDRLLVTDQEVLILDYKTDARPDLSPDTVNPSYLGQLAGYRAAVKLVFPGKRVRAALLWTATPSLMELPEELLDRAAMQETPYPAVPGEP